MPEAAATPTDPTASPQASAEPEPATTDPRAGTLTERVHAAADQLEPLVAQARAVQQERAKAHGAPRWTDVFTTQFTEFSNRPR